MERDPKKKPGLMPDDPTDPLGSWTGTGENPFDLPVQDADDL